MKGDKILQFIERNILINKSLGYVGTINLPELKEQMIELIEEARIGRATRKILHDDGVIKPYTEDGEEHKEIETIRQLLLFSESNYHE